MSINSKILEKLHEKTESEDCIKKIIITLLQRESEGLGQYKDFYKTTIEKNSIEVE